MNIAELLKETRTKRGLSQEKAAEELHVSQTYYSRMERGLIEPDENVLKEIEEFSGLTSEQLESIHPVSAEVRKAYRPARTKKGKETVWLNEFRQVVFLVLIILSFVMQGYGPVFAWCAVWFASKNQYSKKTIIFTTILAVFLTVFVANQFYHFMPSRTWYEVIPS